MAQDVAQGKVKWFNRNKGFGFIEEDSGRDIFVHATALSQGGVVALEEGERVQFEILEGAKGPMAGKVMRLPGH
jgi:CspA family cold shock protein